MVCEQGWHPRSIGTSYWLSSKERTARPQFEALRPWLQSVVLDPAANLFDYLWQSIVKVRDTWASPPDLSSRRQWRTTGLKAQDKVLALYQSAGRIHVYQRHWRP